MDNASPDGPVIAVNGLVRTYGAHRAVDGVDLRVHRGEILALLGPNGAGKTTTVEILEGFRRRDAGQVAVLGQDPARATRAWRARIGIVLQEAKDEPELTVTEALAAQAACYPDPRDVAEVVDAVGLGDKARVRIHSLSGGLKRRLDVGLAVVGRPELVFLDEPTTGFDPQARHAFWDLISTLRQTGVTVLLTTHYLEEAAHLADRVAVVASGRIIAQDTPQDLGGGARRLAEVTWTEVDGTPRRERTGEPTALVAHLTAARPGGEIADLEVRRPTLEDVYLDLLAEHGPEAHASNGYGSNGHAPNPTHATATDQESAA